MALAMPESRLVQIWQDTIRHRADLRTTGNEPVKIIYPGRPNDGRGADLKDAIIATGEGILCGDIEIHVNSSDWRAHGHHADKSYNPVILHVVYRDDAGRAATLENGLEVPTLALSGYAEEQAGGRLTSAFTPETPRPCRQNPPDAGRRLDEAGDARFKFKAAGFQQDIQEFGAEPALYRGLMTGLGYSKNKIPMAALAEAVPLPDLYKIAAGDVSDTDGTLKIEARLLGAAGFIKTDPKNGLEPDSYPRQLEKEWAKSGLINAVKPEDWQLYKIRPGNLPVRRLAGMSRLVTRYRSKGLLEGLKEVLAGAKDNDFPRLEEALAVSAEGYWQRFINLNSPVKGRAPALVGQDRAAEIFINIVLPYFTVLDGQSELAAKALQIYQHYPAPPENALERHVRQQLGLTRDTAGTARRRQGLLHLYKNYCRPGKCAACSLANM